MRVWVCLVVCRVNNVDVAKEAKPRVSRYILELVLHVLDIGVIRGYSIADKAVRSGKAVEDVNVDRVTLGRVIWGKGVQQTRGGVEARGTCSDDG